MSNLNLCQFIGRLGKDPEIKTVGDSAVANFSIGVSKKYTNKQGEKVENTEWVNCQVWGKQAEAIEKYVTKGDMLYVAGELKTRSYEKDGQKHYVTEILVNDFKFFPKPKQQVEEYTGAVDTGLQNKSIKEQVMAKNPVTEPEEDDLPF